MPKTSQDSNPCSGTAVLCSSAEHRGARTGRGPGSPDSRWLPRPCQALAKCSREHRQSRAPHTPRRMDCPCFSDGETEAESGLGDFQGHTSSRQWDLQPSSAMAELGQKARPPGLLFLVLPRSLDQSLWCPRWEPGPGGLGLGRCWVLEHQARTQTLLVCQQSP